MQEETMDNLLYFIIVGLVAGWMAGKIIKGRGFGLVGNLIVGVVGAILGAYIFEFLGIAASGLIGSLIMALVGAVVLLYLIRFVKKL
jgi:uncharacterized membrane protein YeaQ/YmgE (transglycosylase-associated protein family)